MENRCNLRPQKSNENNTEKGPNKGAKMVQNRSKNCSKTDPEKRAEKGPLFKSADLRSRPTAVPPRIRFAHEGQLL